MTLAEAISQNGIIPLSPAGKIGDEYVDGYIEVDQFERLWPDLAAAQVPLSDDQYAALAGIDEFWEANAARWRLEGRI